METQERQRTQGRELHGECAGWAGGLLGGSPISCSFSLRRLVKYVTTGWGRASDSRYPLAPSLLPPGQEIPRRLGPGVQAAES